MNIVVLAIPLIAGILTRINRKRAWTYSFFVMFIYSVCALGWYYNSISRMGNIFISDIYLLLFFLVYLVDNRLHIIMKRQDFLVLTALVTFHVSLGFLYGYALSDILTDFKYVLYFFVPYVYLKNVYDDQGIMKSLFHHYIIMIGISLLLNWMQLFTSGLTRLQNGGSELLRTFAIGMGFSCGALVSCLLMNYRDRFIKRFGSCLYYSIQVLLFISCIASFTRTWWITYILTLGLNWLFVKKINISGKRLFELVRGLLLIGLVMGLVIKVVMSSYPQLVNGIVERIFSIRASINGTQTEYNTFQARIDNILAGADVFFSPRIIWGYGYGSLYMNTSGLHNGCENSILYYIWKYGIIAASYLYAMIIQKVRKLWKSCSMANRTFVIFFICEIIIGSLSGNYHYAYGLGFISFLMGLNYDLIFDEEGIYSEETNDAQ